MLGRSLDDRVSNSTWAIMTGHPLAERRIGQDDQDASRGGRDRSRCRFVSESSCANVRLKLQDRASQGADSGTTEARTRMPSRAADFRTTPAFAGAAPGGSRGLDCALTMCLSAGRPRPSSLYTFTSPTSPSMACLARRRHARDMPFACEEFADFERIPIVVSGRSAQINLKSAVSANSTIIPCPELGPER